MSYREYLPSRELAPYVSCYWSRRASPGIATRVLPDGAVDFLFDVGPGAPRADVVGTMTRALLAPALSDYVAVRFRPAGMRAFLAHPVEELTDRRVELKALLPEAPEWLERIGSERSSIARVRRLDRLLLGALSASRAPDPRVLAGVARLERSGGTLDVASLGSALGLSRQHLTRLFEREVGVSVKTFSRVLRMQSVVARLERARRRPDWAGIALDAGYCDQAHLVNDFRALTGLTPDRFFRSSISPRPEAERSARVSA